MIILTALRGNNTVHDTLGIIYQNIELNTSDESGISEAPGAIHHKKEKKKKNFRCLIFRENYLYKKKTIVLQSMTDEIEYILPRNLHLYTGIYIIWMISHATELPEGWF